MPTITLERLFATTVAALLLTGAALFAHEKLTSAGGLTLSRFPNANFEGPATFVGVAALPSEGAWPSCSAPASAGPRSFRYEGFITIPEDDEYSFLMTSADEARLYLDGELLLEITPRTDARAHRVMRAFEKGVHSIRIDGRQAGDRSSLALEWAVGENRGEPIPPQLLHATRAHAAAGPVPVPRSPWRAVVAIGLALGLASWLARVSGRVPLSRIASRSVAFEDALLVALVAGQVLPVLLIEFFPSTDGPAHLDGADAVLRMLSAGGWLTRKYYEFNPSIVPNWTGHVLLAGLQKIVSPQFAERIVVASYAVLMPVTCRYAIAGFSPRGTWAAILVTPFTFTWLLAMGFYNFCLGLPLMFLLIGYWFRYHRSASVVPVVVIAGLCVVTFFSNPLPLAMAVGAIACFTMSWVVSGLLRKLREGARAKSVRFDMLPTIRVTLSGLSPALVLLGYFFLTRGPSLGDPADASVLWDYMRRLLMLVSIDEAEATPAALVFWLLASAGVAGLAVKGVQGIRQWDIWLVPVGGTCLLYFLLPDSRFHGQFLTPRLLLFSFLFLVLWLGSVNLPVWLRRSIIVSISIAVMWMSVLRAAGYAWFSPLLVEYVSVADHLAKNSTLLTLSYRPAASVSDTYGQRIRPFVHAGGYLSGSTGVLNMTNYEGDFRYFPLRFRDDVNPYVHVAAKGHWLESMRPCVDVVAFNRRTRERVDYVLTWGLDEAKHGDACTASLLGQLEQGYDLVHVTEPRGWGRLYRRRDFRRYDAVEGRIVPELSERAALPRRHSSARRP